ncbi:shikimate dehydrogenase [Elusimicrobium posterum]|uniref:shikimate dehydrogenase n=1 Tax=Elusimicrobium posterum TaxID=3116653 RepID=UPI003C7267FE
MKLILIGFMGAGKTTVGRALARTLGLGFVDMDTFILKRTSYESIAQIFEKHGEAFFRDLEARAAANLKGRSDIVISCGGGIINKPDALEALKEGGGTCIYLHSSFDGLKKRIANFESRPLFQDHEAAAQLYEKRLAEYKRHACYVVDTEGMNVPQAMIKVLKTLAGAAPKNNLIIGSPVEHSMSPILHGAGYKAIRIDGTYTFGRQDVKPQELEEFLKNNKDKFNGLSVTMPLKTEIIKHLDYLDNAAREIGAVNTVLNQNGKLKGYNTDCYGVRDPLGGARGVKDKTVAIIGAGGAARAALYAVKDAGQIMLFNRDFEKAKALAAQFNATAYPLTDIEKVTKADIIINTTSVGMGALVGETPVPAQYLREGQTVFDAVYNPLETRLIKEAKAKGLNVITGDKMLLAQAYKQFEILSGFKAPKWAMDKALKKTLEARAAEQK